MPSKTLLFVAVLLMIFANTAQAHHDSNTDPNNYDEAIHALMQEGIVKGNESGDINAEGTLNRAELTAIVMRAKGVTPEKADKACFSDVESEWYAGVICAAKRLNIINGYPDGKFRPGREVTAGEAAKIMVNSFSEFSFQDLNEANRFVESLGFHRQKYGVDTSLKRNEAFERLYRLRKANLYQHDDQGNAFDPERDTMMMVEADGSPFYIDYNDAQYDRHLGKDPLILFFYAAWCPLCRSSDATLEEAFPDLKGGVIWMKVDYDTELELRKKYGVTYQDTFVILDASGEVVKKDNGVSSAAEAQQLMDLALGQ